jgi:hypothetical protein
MAVTGKSTQGQVESSHLRYLSGGIPIDVFLIPNEAISNTTHCQYMLGLTGICL